jgi:phosphoglycolate phosphatase-like HAD superfamily hydrolase
MIQTSNSVRAVREVWERLAFPPVDAVIGRESARRPKPHPEGVLRALRRMGLRGSETIVIGDGDFDVELGRAIGAVTVRLRGTAEHSSVARADYIVDSVAGAAALLTGERLVAAV